MIILCGYTRLLAIEARETEGEKKINIAISFSEWGEKYASSAQAITAMRTSATRCATTAIECTSTTNTPVQGYALSFKRRQTNSNPEMPCSAVLVVGKESLNSKQLSNIVSPEIATTLDFDLMKNKSKKEEKWKVQFRRWEYIWKESSINDKGVILALGKVKSRESLTAVKWAAKIVIYLGWRSTPNGWRSSWRENSTCKLFLADIAGKFVLNNQR